MRYFVSFFLVILFNVSLTLAQTECPNAVIPEESLPLCHNFGIDQACFLAGDVNIIPRVEANEFVFENPGDIIDLTNIAKLELRGNSSVLFHFTANFSDGQFVTALVFGEAILEFPITPAVNLTLSADTNVNIRGGAGTDYLTVGRLDANTSATAIGKNATGDWFFIQFGDNLFGWVFSDLVTVVGDTSRLSILADDVTISPVASAVSVMNIRPNSLESNCSQTNLILQAPQNGGNAEFIVNNTYLEISSSVSVVVDSADKTLASLSSDIRTIITDFDSLQTELAMRIQTLQGLVKSTAFTQVFGGTTELTLRDVLANSYVQVKAQAGTEALIPLDGDLLPLIQPVVVPYPENSVNNLIETISWEQVFNQTIVLDIPPTLDELLSMQANQRIAVQAYEEGVALYWLAQYKEAFDAFNRAIELDSSFADAYAYRGGANRALENIEEAMSDFDTALQLNPNSALVYALRSRLRSHMGDSQGAFEDANRAIELDTTSYISYYSRAFVNDLKGDNNLAIADYTMAITLNPEFFFGYHNRGLIYLNISDYSHALSDFTEAIRLNPQDTSSFFNRAYLYSEIGEYDLSIADYNEVIRINPEDADAYNGRGYAYFNKGEYQTAIANYDQALRINPNHEFAAHNREIALRRLNN